MNLSSWRIRPAGPLAGRLCVPGDKSVSHRVLILGAVAGEPLEADGFLPSEDCLATRSAVEAVGVRVEDTAGGGIRVIPPESLSTPSAPLDLGNAGTGIRLLLGLLAGQGVGAELTGDASLRRRPMARVVEPLVRMGARIESASGYPPLRLAGGARLQPLRWDMPMASAQVKSALLLAGMAAEGRTTITQPAPTRDHTERLLAALGCPVSWNDRAVALDGPCQPRGGRIVIPGDFSSAAFFLVAALIGAGDEPVTLRGVGVNPTRTGLLDILAAMGARIELTDRGVSGGEPTATLRAWRSELTGVEVPPELVSRAIDEFPALFVAAAFARGATRVRGAAELRVKESDRLSVMARGLGALGVFVREHVDGLEIRGGRIHGGSVDSGGDHRVAMAFAVAGCRVPLTVHDVAPVATSFPGFVASAATLGLAIEPTAAAAAG